MSRVTQAFIRSGRENGDSSPAGLRDREKARWMSVSPPWDLCDTPRIPAAPGTAAPMGAESERTDVAGTAGAGVPGELTALVQRILQRRHDEARIQSALFAGVDADACSGAVCVGTAVELTVHTASTLCVIDCNLRSSTLTGALSVAGNRGLSDVLFGREAFNGCLVRLAPNVWFLPSGQGGDDVETRMTAEQMRVHLRESLTTFDYVLLDSGPLAAQGDGALLGTIVDAMVLVVDARSTRREAARRAARQLRSARVNVIGAVLTNRTFPIPEAIYRTL